MEKQTVVLVDGDSLQYSEAVKLYQIAQQRNMEIQLAVKVPEIPAAFYQVPSTTQVEQKLVSQMERKLAELGRILNVPKNGQKAIREPNKSLQDLAKEIDAQLIINGCDESFFEKICQFITGKKKVTQEEEVPSLKLQEYVDMLTTLTNNRSKQPRSPENIAMVQSDSNSGDSASNNLH